MMGRLILFICMAAGAASPTAVSPSSGLIGAPMTARVTVELAPGEKAEFPAKLPLPADMELLGMRGEPVIQSGGGALSQSAEYAFAVYKLGSGEFPSVEVVITGADGKSRTFTAPPAAFEIVSARTDPKTAEQLVEIRPPMEMPLDWGRYLAPSLAFLILLIAAFLLWRYLRRKKANAAAEPPPLPKVPPRVTAMESLRKLKEDDLFARGEGRKFFFILSEIMRGYVEERYGAPALERTTAEIEQVFDLRFERKEKRDRLLSLLEFCDMFKFTKISPAREDGDRAFDMAVAWVEETSPPEPALEAK